MYMPTMDYAGEHETTDNTVNSYTITNLEGCLSCYVWVFARTSVGFGKANREDATTVDGKRALYITML